MKQMEDGMLLDLFGSLSREIGDVRVEMREGFDRLERSQAKTEATLRRAILLAVRDARRQRERNAQFDKRNAEFDKRHAEFDQRHLAAEEQMQELRLMMKAFLERSGNGRH
jgi:hypothetical protein